MPGSTSRTSIHWIRRQRGVSLAQRTRRLAAHLYRAARAGGEPALITPGDFDVIELLAVDEQARLGLLHRLARQPDPALPFSRPLRRHRPRERVTPTAVPGCARLRDFAGRPLGDPPVFGVRHDPNDHPGQPARSRDGPHACRQQGAQRQGRLRSRRDETEFFRVDIGEGVSLDGWCMFPPDFDSRRQVSAAGPRLRRARRPDRARSLGGWQPPLAPRCSLRTDISS